ncbi:MAG: NAD(P)H-binding protein [Planctomycetes bacterium]|jgi:NADH dehydrogenase|nr:NAD(P)H-binding protein [Planctomycetota bacterium]
MATPKKVLVTGGAGFVGTLLCQAIVAAPGLVFRALDLPGSRLDALARDGETVAGDLLLPGVLESGLAGCSAAVHLVVAHEHAPLELHEKLTIGGARRVVEAAKSVGVRRLLFMSSIKAARDYEGFYGACKRRAEAIVRESGLDWTIFRPGLLYGPGETRLSAIARTLRAWPVFPLPGDGSYPIYPLRTVDLVAALLRALESSEAIGRIYELGSDRPWRLDEIVRLVGEHIGQRRPILKLPLSPCRALGALAEKLTRHPVLFAEQIKAMQVRFPPPDTEPAKRDLGFTTVPFPQGLAELAAGWAARRPR